MASTDKPADPEAGKEVPPPSTAVKEANPPPPPPPRVKPDQFFVVEVSLRFLVFAASLTSVLVVVTSKQTIARGPLLPPSVAEFNHSPAFIYFVAALSVAGLYAILTTLASISVIFKPIFSSKFLLHFAFFDVLILGLVASATGTAGGVAYIGYKGNKYVPWQKVCSAFDKYCQHIAGALATSLLASVLLVLLVWLSTFTLHRKIPN